MRKLQETDGSQGLTAYDELFVGYPTGLKRFLPAAHVQVRNDPAARGLEVADPRAFRQAVAQAAFQMSKLSASDTSPHRAPTAPILDPRQTPYPFAEEATLMVPDGSKKPAIPPIRIQYGDEGLYMLRIGPETRSGISEEAVLTRLSAWGVNPEDAAKWIELAKFHGVCTALPRHYDPEDFNDLDMVIGKGKGLPGAG